MKYKVSDPLEDQAIVENFLWHSDSPVKKRRLRWYDDMIRTDSPLHIEPVFENRTFYGDTERVVRVYLRGIRVVMNIRDDYWSLFVIVPRKTLLAAVRKMRAAGYAYHDCDWWRLLPNDGSHLFCIEHYGGPGRSFAQAPGRYRRSACNRNWYVFYQSGGLDV